MVHVTIEYMIMIPVMILQIFLFPIVANVLMNTWVDQRRTLVLQEVTGSLGSTIQQLYSSLNHYTVPSGNVTYSPGLPPFIENLFYTGKVTLLTGSASTSNSTIILELMTNLVSTSDSATTTMVLGSNVLWQPSTFVSNSASASVNAEKFLNGTILLWFGS
jgi:hypothetical protein